jgi:hypothetical protein
VVLGALVTFPADRLRIYYNTSGNANKAWSIDCGYGTPEILVEAVVLEGVNGITYYCDVEDLPKNEPRGYLEVSLVMVTLFGNRAEIKGLPFSESAPAKE